MTSTRVRALMLGAAAARDTDSPGGDAEARPAPNEPSPLATLLTLLLPAMRALTVVFRQVWRCTAAPALVSALAHFIGPTSVRAQAPAADRSYDPTAATETIALWNSRAPYALGDEPTDRPTLTVFRPFGQRPTDPPRGAVIVFPGGGYVFLAANHEGRQVANYLNSLGLTAFVLRYRVAPRYRDPVPMLDAQRAIRFVRAHAGEYGLRPDQIGVLGFSAGGHLAATVATHFDDGRADAADSVDRASSRPDFLVLGYPVVSLSEPFAHRGSGESLLGRDATDRQRAERTRGDAPSAANAAGVPRPHGRRRWCAAREQCRVLSGAAPRSGSGRAPRVRAWSAWAGARQR